MSFSVRNPKPAIVFFDFDNTITCEDVLDSVIERFSINKDWIAYEELWKAGEIGSRECLEAQLQSVRVTERELAEFVTGIKIDPAFVKLLKILEKRKIPSMIVSDSFSFIIRTILGYQEIPYETVYANELRFDGSRIIPSFPYASKDCPRCAHCKKVHIRAFPERTKIYIGDGLSDVCPALESDMVFAKNGLIKYLQNEGKLFTAFNDLGDVCHFFEGTQPGVPQSEATIYVA